MSKMRSTLDLADDPQGERFILVDDSFVLPKLSGLQVETGMILVIRGADLAKVPSVFELQTGPLRPGVVSVPNHRSIDRPQCE
jgi:hypothetical protein